MIIPIFLKQGFRPIFINIILATLINFLSSKRKAWILAISMLIVHSTIVHSQIDFVFGGVGFTPNAITVGNTSLLQFSVSTNSTMPDLSGSLGVGCLKIGISMPITGNYVPMGGAAAVQNTGIGNLFNWTYDAMNNLLYGVNNVPFVDGSGGLITVKVMGMTPTSVPAVTAVNLNDVLNCTNTNSGNNDSGNASLTVLSSSSIALSCVIDTVFYYVASPSGVTIYADDLYTSASTGSACQPITFYLNDGIRRQRDSLDYGINDLFNPPLCIILTAKNACGDSVNCKVNVSILDTIPPVIICPPADTFCTASQIPPVITTTANFIAAGGVLTDATFGTATQSGFLSWLGDKVSFTGCNHIVERKYRIEDYFENADTCSQFFVIEDTLGITSPLVVNLNASQGQCSAMYSPLLTFHSNCKIDTFYHNGPSNNLYIVGTTMVKFTIINICNDTFMKSLSVIVSDLQPPTLICPANITVCSTPMPFATISEFIAAGGLVSDNCMLGNLTNTSISTSINCPKVTTNTYTVTDVNNNTASCTHQITTNDVIPPTITDPADITLFTSGGLCSSTSNLALPLVNDNCGPVTITRIPSGNVFNKGVTNVVWTATDGCGNTATTAQIITVLDDDGPELTCKGGKEINLSFGNSFIHVDSLIIATSDNCPGAITRKVRRMTSNCVPPSTTFGDKVYFCCDDVNKNVQVLIQVTDVSGNTSTCMVNIAVKDKLKPLLEEDLRDISVSCDYEINLSDMSAFGTYVFSPEDRETIEIDDELFETLPGIFLDGWVTDNCVEGLVLTILPPMDMRDAHNKGNIIRKFIVTDAAGNTLALDQIITVVDTDPLTLNDIHFPPDANYSDCSLIPPPTTLTGNTTFDTDDICTIPAATFKDQIFDDPTSGCVYIRRKWKVIDWGQYVPNTNIGIWEHTQNIHLINNVKPTITSSCANRTVCAVNAECDAVVKLGLKATDDCTAVEDLIVDFKIDLNNNGSIDVVETGDTFNIRMQRGTHLIQWRVEDRCGNFSSCMYTVTVKECKAPTPICMNGLSTNLENDATSVVWASDFNNSSYDNCTKQENLKYSFSSNINDTKKTLTCATKGNINVTMWVTDEDGNQSKCNTFILVTDNKLLCPPTVNTEDGIMIAGRVVTEEDAHMKNVEVAINESGNSFSIATDEEGNYLMPNLQKDKNYLLSASYDGNWIEGISTLDLVLIQRHILGVKKLISPFKLIAADANNDTKVTASDLVALRKLILGIIDSIPENNSWRFMDKDIIFADMNQPWPFVESIRYDSLNINMMNTDFYAIKVGDVNGTVSEKLNAIETEARNKKVVDIKMENIYFDDGKYINVPIYINEEVDVNALQLEFKLKDENLEFIGIMDEGLSITNDGYHFNPNSKSLKIAYFNKEAVNMRSNGVLFTLQFRSKNAGRLGEALQLSKTGLDALIINDVDLKLELNLVYGDDYEALSVSQNVPNPFVDQTEVKFFIAETGIVEINIYDNSGIKIYSDVRNFNGGVNQIRVDKEILKDQKGIFYLHISTGEKTEIKKMMRLN